MDINTSNPAWMEDAFCRGAGPKDFYAHSEGDSKEITNNRYLIRQTKLAYCNRCTVRSECLEFAMTTYQKHGIWGGLTERERVNLRRSQRKSSEK